MEVTTEMRSALMKGRMTALPPDKSNIVRIFMSSTFSDMAKERNILLQKAYPELREFCQKQGLDFQVMDMRWGVRDEVVADHMTCALCLMEIDTCKRLSVGPNFVAFLGNRYGYRPIPAKIEAEELDILLKKASELDMDTTVIKEWYLKDDNAVPTVCLLQPITSKFKYYTDMEPVNESLRQKDKEGWHQVTVQLENILRTAVKAAHKEGLVTEEQQHKYIKSVTEIEIKRGIMESTDANQRAAIFMRNLQNIEKHVGADAVSAYLDLMDREKLNEESQRLLEDLKVKLPSKLKNVHQYEVEWTDKGVNEDIESHASYLEQFSDDFVDDLKTMIFRSLQSARESEEEQNDDWFLTEVMSHARFCQAKCESFCGRQEIFDAVYTYMKDTAKVNHQPFVIHGASGTGKSSILAMLAQNAAQTCGENLVTIIRFLGTSPHSTLIHPVLQSLCLQICEVYGIESPVERVLNNFAEIVQYLSTLLDKVSEKDRPLLILLDSLDQLSSVDRAYSLTWLPKSLPPNVHIVVSTLPDEFDLLKTLKRTIRSDKSYIQVPTLSEQVGGEILDTWLAQVQRCLTDKQREVILSAFSHCRQPLFLKVAFDEARRWKSYTPESELRVAQSARAAINLLYERLEVQHGTIFVSHTLGYIAAARKGISEHELEDVLSLDDEVLDDVYQYWSPPNKDLVRIPPLIVTRLKYDIMEYLAERQADGKRVLQLFHRQFIECAQERYLSGDNSRARHHVLVDFFLGTWSNGRKKEITMEVNGKKEYYNADRSVVPQPMKYDDNVFNRRKLNEVTFHLLHAGRMDDIFEHTLGNLAFMNAKTDALGVKSLIEDYNMVLQMQDNLEIRLLRDALRLIKPTLEFKGGPLRTTLAHHRDGITSIAMTPDGGYMMTAARDCTIRIYENESDVMELERTLTGHTAAIEVLAAAPNNELLVSGSLDNTLKVWNLETGRLVITMEEDHAHYRHHALLTTTMDSRKVVSPAGKVVNVWDIESGKLQFTLKGHEGAVSCLAVSHDNKYIITGAEDNTIKMWSTETGELKNTFSHHTDDLTCLKVTQDGRIVSGSKDTAISVIDIENSEVVHRLEGHSHPVYSLAITSDGKYAVSGSDKVVKLWDLSKGKEVHHLQGHYGIVDYVGVTSDNKVIVSGARDEHLNVWDFESGLLVQTLDGQAAKITAMEVTAYIVVTASTDSYYTKVWDVEQSKMKMSTPRFIDKYGIVGVTSDAGYVVYKREGSENEVNVWNSKDGKDIRTITDKDGSITYLRVTHDNNCVVTGDEAGFIKLWNLNTGQLIRQLDRASGGIRCFWITRGDRYLVAVTDNNSVSAWDIDSMMILWTRKPNCEGKITCVTMTDDRKYTAIGTEKKEIVLLNNELDKVAYRLVGHQSPLTCLSVSHNQKLLASGSSGETMRVWDLGTGRLVHELYAKSPVFKGIVCLSFSYDDKYLLTGGHDRSLKMWDLQTGNMLTAQYVYATITCIVANRDNIVLTTKLGYVIVEDVLLPGTSPLQEEGGAGPTGKDHDSSTRREHNKKKKKSCFCCQIL
ncbi:NWD1 [Branchiostoma lanceolatum]|uniref:NWD1 protein n=1 Tax=Branchiostoma lanceolatum TaxID=7740 RepID=A0A8K0A034_BRALA|nr:NWD1 [Branchiostoma lanceolatum]